MCETQAAGSLLPCPNFTNLFDPNLLISLNAAFTASTDRAPFEGQAKPFGPALVVQGIRDPGDIKLIALDLKDAKAIQNALNEDKKKPSLAKEYNSFLYYPSLGVVLQGAGSAVGLDKNAHFIKLLTQFKFLSGEIHVYNSQEIGCLKAWLGGIHDIISLEKFFVRSLIRTYSQRVEYEFSLLCGVFNEIKQKLKTHESEIKGKADRA